MFRLCKFHGVEFQQKERKKIDFFHVPKIIKKYFVLYFLLLTSSKEWIKLFTISTFYFLFVAQVISQYKFKCELILISPKTKHELTNWKLKWIFSFLEFELALFHIVMKVCRISFFFLLLFYVWFTFFFTLCN